MEPDSNLRTTPTARDRQHLRPRSGLLPPPPRSFPDSFLSSQRLTKRDLQEAIKLLSLIPTQPQHSAVRSLPKWDIPDIPIKPENPSRRDSSLAVLPLRGFAAPPRPWKRPGKASAVMGAAPSPPLQPSTFIGEYVPKIS